MKRTIFAFRPAILLSGLLSAALACPVAVPAQHAAITPQPPAQAPVTTPASAASGPQDSATYVIGADDVLQVTVWKEPTLSGPLTVRPDGMISLPLVGDVAAAGMTPMKLGADVTERLKKFITDPVVTVTVTAVNSKRVFLIGEVQHIGPVPITPGMTPLQAISSAGGLTPFANQRKIYILRGPQGHQTKIPFDYKKAVKQGDFQGVTLEPGDTIVIP